MSTNDRSELSSALVTSRRCMRTKATACAAVVLVGMAAGAAPSAANASERCYVWTYAHTMKKLRVPLLDSHARLKWCTDRHRNVITGFEVQGPYAEVRNTAWLRNPGRQDVRQTNPLGQRSLHVSGDFSAYSTVKGSASLKLRGFSSELTWTPGTLGDHFEVDLYPDGVVTGRAWSG